MKASLKFRGEDQKPLIRAKVPLNILGFPFQSGIKSGCDSKEFSLNLSTFFESGGPCLKFSYRPNDSWNPFSVIVKTGIGAFGSPISAPLSMSAEFNLLGTTTGNPSFFLHFKPQIGDFTVKKSVSSTLPVVVQSSSFFFPKIVKLTTTTPAKDLDSDAEGSVDGVETPFYNGVNGLLTGSNAVSSFDGLVNGIEVNATSILPMRNRACLKFRWGVRFPAELLKKKSFITDEEEEGIRNPTAGISHRKIPFLVMSKISFEHVAGADSSTETTKRGPADGISGVGSADVAETFFAVKRQMEVLQIENGSLRKAVEELRSEFGSGNSGAGSQDSGKKYLGGGKNDRDRRSKRDDNVSGELIEKDSIGSNV